jgi:hypothetical protein
MTRPEGEQETRIINLYKEGHSYDRIVELSGFSYYHVKECIKRNRNEHGLKRRKSFYAVAKPLNSVSESAVGFSSALCRKYITEQWGKSV